MTAERREPDGAIVNTQHLCVAFDGATVLQDVSITLAPAQVTALLGPNGSGKSTLINALVGLQPVQHGTVELFGIPLGRFSQWQRLALVPQHLPGASSIPVSVWETVMSARISPRRRWRPIQRSERQLCTDALDRVGLLHRRRDRLDSLSGGQQRRVMLARALAADAQLLILDEPTAGMDAQNLQVFVEVIAHQRELGRTVLIVTHDLDDIEHLIDQAIVLEASTDQSVVFAGLPPLPPSMHHVAHHHHETPPQGAASPVVAVDP